MAPLSTNVEYSKESFTQGNSTSTVRRRWHLQTTIAHLPCCADVCHLFLQPCSHTSRLLSLMTMLAKSVSSTKSEVMMLTPSVPGLWASTQDMMAGRFLESHNKKDTHTRSITNTLIFSSTSEPPAEQNQEVSVFT